MPSCKHPLVRDKDTGRVIGSIQNIEYWGGDTSKYLNNPRYQLIPCGQCIACRINYSKEWAARCIMETIYHEENWFVTLTYDNDHVPTIDLRTGELTRGGYWILEEKNPGKEIIQSLSLLPLDLQLFMKRMRITQQRNGWGNIRFYSCGEYGGQTLRPHYHILMYGLHVPDLTYFKTDKDTGCEYYLSEYIAKIWGMGHIIIGKVTWNSCAYVSRYVMKKQLGKDENGLTAKDRYLEAGLEPEFVRMSLKPGIGQQYYQDHKQEIYLNDEIILPGGKKPIVMKPPKKFDEWFENEYPDQLAIIKEAREEGVRESQRNKMKQTSNDYIEVLETEERLLKNRMKNIRRLGNDE